MYVPAAILLLAVTVNSYSPSAAVALAFFGVTTRSVVSTVLLPDTVVTFALTVPVQYSNTAEPVATSCDAAPPKTTTADPVLSVKLLIAPSVTVDVSPLSLLSSLELSSLPELSPVVGARVDSTLTSSALSEESFVTFVSLVVVTVAPFAEASI